MATPEHLDLEAPPRAAHPGHQVPAGLAALLEQHGVDPEMDSRRHLRRTRWPRSGHALGAVCLAAFAVFITPQHLVCALLAVALAVAGAAVILVSHAARPGQHALRELGLLTISAVAVSLFASTNPLPLDLAPGMIFPLWYVFTGVATMACGVVVIAGMEAYPRTARFCAGMIGVLTAAALGN